MANEGFVIVKKGRSKRADITQFYQAVDKGSSKPAFCYPRRITALKEEVATMTRVLEAGQVNPERKMQYELKLKQYKDRVKQLDESVSNAKAIIDKDPDFWKKRRDELADEISSRVPSKEDVQKRRVNPHSVLRSEKQGDKESRPLEEVKREYTIISRGFQARGDYEEANHSFLQRDK